MLVSGTSSAVSPFLYLFSGISSSSTFCRQGSEAIARLSEAQMAPSRSYETERKDNKTYFSFKHPEKIQACTGFEPMTSAIPVQCSTN